MSSGTLLPVLFATNSILFLAALYWTATSWLRIAHLSRQPPWLLRRCLIHEKATPVSNGLYRAEFLVSNFSATAPAEQTTAFRYGSPVYNQTYLQASAFAESFERDSWYGCWIAEEAPPWRVSMQSVRPGPSRADGDLALMSSLLLAVSAFSLMVVAVSAVRRRVGARVMVSLGGGIAVPGEAVREALSEDEIDRVCGKLEDGSVDTCAICLEDGGAGVALPCGHAFHDACIRAWLFKGGDRCPLCCCQLGRRAGRESCSAGEAGLD